MDKLLLFPGKSERGVFTHLIDYERAYLTKTASQGAYHPTIASYISNAKTIPGKTQILLTALGSGEYWGDNANGDYFPESELAHDGDEFGYRTFMTHAKIYKHHVNKNPAAAFGDVPLSVFNPTFHRVELIVLLDNAKAPDIADQVENGLYPDWSMGTRIPYDVCSICGNKAPNMKFYCAHAKYLMGRIDPETGRKVFVRNYKPKFFDISYVLIGADRIAKTLRKVAHARPIYYGIGSAALAEKAAEEAKRAAIEKQVPAGQGEPPSSQTLGSEVLREIGRTIPDVKAREKPLPRDVLDGLSKMPLTRSLSTMTMLGILPKPEEFQRLFLLSKGLRELADGLERKALCFDPMMKAAPDEHDMGAFDIDHRHFDDGGMQMLLPFIPERSYASPHLSKRIAILIKTGADASKSPLPSFLKKDEPDQRTPVAIFPLMLAAAGAYAALSKKAPEGSLRGIDKLLQSKAGLGLATALGVGLLSIFHSTFGPKVKGQFTPGDYVNPDANDIGARIREHEQKPYLKLGGVSNLGAAGRRLFVGVPSAYMGSGVLAAHRDANPNDQESRLSSFVRQYPDVISGGLIADAALSAKGGGTHGLGKSLLKSLKKVAEDDRAGANHPEKTADVQEYLSNAVTWPLAMGKANLPARMVGGLLDQGVIQGLSRAMKKKPESN